MMQNENWPVSGWRTAEPGEQGMNRELPQRLHSVITSDYANTNGIVVVRNGCIVCEEYFHGFGPDVPVHVARSLESILELEPLINNSLSSTKSCEWEFTNLSQPSTF